MLLVLLLASTGTVLGTWDCISFAESFKSVYLELVWDIVCDEFVRKHFHLATLICTAKKAFNSSHSLDICTVLKH